MNAPLTTIHRPPPPTPSVPLDPRAYARGLSCVHCGLCLPACPTYTQTDNEADSPRGRIQLMLALADGLIQPTASVRGHLDLCLDCRSCETACPSGVVYHELIEEARPKLARFTEPSLQSRFMRWVFLHIFAEPRRLKLVLLPARVAQKIGLYALLRKSGIFKLLPMQLRKMEQMLPPDGPLWPNRLPYRIPPVQNPKSKIQNRPVAFFTGCIGSVMYEEVNRKAVELLSACGADVTVEPTQVCCGAIHHHNADPKTAARLARHNIDAFIPPGGSAPSFITTTIAGCGAMLREYDVLLRDDPVYRDRAKEFVSKVRDVSEVLFELGLPEMSHAIDETVTYHDACHLAHAQGVTLAPRKLLAMIPGLKLVSLPESDICCGAAGTYNLTQPEMASALAERKLRNIASTGAATCAMGNVGCAMHIRAEAAARGSSLSVVHPVELLHRAVFGAIE